MIQRFGRLMPFGRQKRNITTSSVRKAGDHHDEGGVPGKNLPYDITNRHTLALYMGLWMGSGFATPFLLLRHHLVKNRDK